MLDIGCGTGLLSIFAAKAGAKKVYGVEFADIADYVRELANFNRRKKLYYKIICQIKLQ